MNIDRHNYEEFFILYLDNELSAEDRRAVEAFAITNPDLKEELDMLLQSKLSPDMDITLYDKSQLFRFDTPAGINLSNYEQWLSTYTDDELNAEQRTTVEQFAAVNPVVATELSLFLQTKLQPDTSIIFPDKSSLYRKEEKVKVVAIKWWRIAVAAIFLIGLSTGVYQMMDQKKQARLAGNTGTRQKTAPANTISQPTVAETNVASSEQTATPVVVTTVREQSTTLVHDKNNRIARDNGTHEIQQEVIPVNNRNNEKPLIALATGNDLKNTAQENQSIAANINANINSTPALTNIQLNKPERNVTPDNGYSSDMQEQQAITTEDVAAANQSGKKSKFRGFFRKVTRTFEKTTNLKATDDQDRLLLGGLAIKL